MWSRTAEFMIGCWLLMSPFVFGHQSSDTYFWIGDLGGGTLLILFSLLSFWEPTRRAHMLTPVLGLSLIAIAFLVHPHPLPPALQNHCVVGLLIVMTGIIPGDALLPPESWREYERKRKAAGAYPSPEARSSGGPTSAA